MDANFYSRLVGGRRTTITGLPVEVADRMFNAHKNLLSDPFVTYYRVTLSDPLRGGYIVRDTDQEIHGIGGHPSSCEALGFAQAGEREVA